MANPNQIFNTVTFKAPRRSLQNLSNTYKGVTGFGVLNPIGVYEIYPGDVMSKSTNIFMRAMPMLAPILHECDIYVHDFFVPWRLIWDDYEKYLIPQDNETSETIPVKPYMSPVGNSTYGDSYFAALKVGSLGDKFGLPCPSAKTDMPNTASDDNRICTLPFRAYQLIWNEYYRDQNLQDPVEIDKSSGVITGASTTEVKNKISALTSLRYRAWEKDYFTSALPRPQKGEPMGIDLRGTPGQRLEVMLDKEAGDPIIVDANQPHSGALSAESDTGRLKAGTTDVWINPNGSLYVTPEGTNQGYFTIEMLREAMRLQEFMEQLMRGGSRYAEVVRNMFGQIPDDLRVGRPAYLGGSKQNLVISEVLQQSQSVGASQALETSSLGEMAGHGISIGGRNHWKALFKEHGYVISLMSVRPRSAYMQGVNKLWLKDDRYEEMWPLFAHLGEQPVMNGELYWSWTDGKNRDTFGYQPIYTEMRTKPSICTGELRTNLDFWHLNRKFDARPELNGDFITCAPADGNRIFAVQSTPTANLIFEASNAVKMIRCIPRDGNPTL